ncbi:hypothetical protein IFM89_021853 [Coptis chinensis]|uniref:DUF7722 domain-containing protein n=1 Tax=Coptis chinensis TaxID=261450 RepID=A0A835I530_9MAGN|nr:hypothetical protein IFM89_021853 [Coptis chinensis]
MALRWLVNTVCTSTFGYPKDLNTKHSHPMVYPNGDLINKSQPKDTYGESLKEEICATMFQMPLHYPRYKKADYEKMEEWKVDMLLRQYGLSYEGSLSEKRSFAMGAFLWPDQY